MYVARLLVHTLGMFLPLKTAPVLYFLERFNFSSVRIIDIHFKCHSRISLREFVQHNFLLKFSSRKRIKQKGRKKLHKCLSSTLYIL